MCECSTLKNFGQTCEKCGKTLLEDGTKAWIIKVGEFYGGEINEKLIKTALQEMGYDESKLSDGAFIAYIFRLAIIQSLKDPKIINSICLIIEMQE